MIKKDKKRKCRKAEKVHTTEECIYGCGRVALYVLPSGKLICDDAYQKCPVLRERNSKGLVQHYITHGTNRLPESAYSASRETSHRAAIENRFRENSHCSNQWAKKILIEYFGHEDICVECGVGSSWNGKPLVLQLDHINGKSTDFRVDNLRIMCPNCHSQTSTFCGKSINTGKKVATDQQLIYAIETSPNVRQALIKVGMTPKGNNYDRVYKLINENGLSFNSRKSK